MLSVPQRETVHATVSGIGDGWIDLDMQSSPRTPMQQLERSTLFVEFINDEGRDDVVRFAHKHVVQLLQRREHIRAYVALKLDCWRPVREEGPPMSARTIDISGGGLLVRDLPRPRTGEKYVFELTLDERELPVRGRFTVCRVTGEGFAGVEFTVLDLRERSLTTHMAFDLQREQKRSLA